MLSIDDARKNPEFRWPLDRDRLARQQLRARARRWVCKDGIGKGVEALLRPFGVDFHAACVIAYPTGELE
jgi:hypothetical protein